MAVHCTVFLHVRETITFKQAINQNKKAEKKINFVFGSISISLFDMVNPGSFKGKCLAFLESQKEVFIAAVKDRSGKEKKTEIIRNFFRRFPASQPESWEPTDEELAAVRDDVAMEEDPTVNVDTMSEEERVVHFAREAEIMASTAATKASISRWLDYRYKKHQNPSTGANSKNSHESAVGKLMLTLVGDISKPRRQPAMQLWASKNKSVFRSEYDVKLKVWKESPNYDKANKSKTVNLHSEVVSAHWERLSKEEKAQWADRAKEEHKKELDKWWKELGDYSTDPKDRQECINKIIHFFQPLLNEVCATTGLKGTLLLGGPEPADNGRLNVISIHSGADETNFGTLMCLPYKEKVLPVFGEFLRQSYTKAECRARALPKDDDNQVSTASSSNEGLDVFTIEYDRPTPQSAAEASPKTTPPLAAQLSATEPASATSVGSGVPRVNPEADKQPSSPPSPPSPAPSPAPASPSPPAPSPTPASRPVSPVPSPVPGSRCASPAPHPTAPIPLHLPVSPHASPVPSPSNSPSISPSSTTQDSEMIELSSESDTDAGTCRKCLRGEDDTAEGRQTRQKVQKEKSSTADASKLPNGRQLRQKAQQGKFKGSSSIKPGAKSDQSHRGKQKNDVVEKMRSGSLTTPTLPTPCPTYLKGPFTMFSLVDDNDFRAMLCKYIVFEHSQRYTDGKLSAMGRPIAVGNWVSRARNPGYRPPATSLLKDQATFENWYDTLQPEGRELTLEGLRSQEGSFDWTQLCHSGQNGVMSVVAALFFWHSNIVTASRDVQKKLGYCDQVAIKSSERIWRNNVQDFTFALSEMAG
ncbi:hypothetical protein D9758_018183 [Tetrapyrgos nigripes]|uniref:Uncharacterized protein n=1 Tax=Tetrapyrgos nigripes TaxID=182062 RepID=A0A8H5C7J9_9AGAR|nr:hypothetical protein D9758_018183 [Tetrapyrgos nigripes]